MNRWSMAETRECVEKLFGRAHLEEVRQSIAALSARPQYAHYHYHELRRLMQAYCLDYLKTTPLFVAALSSTEGTAKFDRLLVEVGAHALGSVLSIHAIADVSAFAAYYCLGYNRKPDALKERYVTHWRVAKALRANSAHEGVASILERFGKDPSFQYIDALANRSKHQAIVRPKMSEDLTGEQIERHAIKFEAFRHAGKWYSERECGTALAPAFEMASRAAVDMGNQLNELFRKGLV